MIDAILGGLAVVLLLAVAAARLLAWKTGAGPWARTARVARVGAIVALAAALAAGISRTGGWGAYDLWLLGLGLVGAALTLDEVLARGAGVHGASPLLDVLSALLLGVLLYAWPMARRPLLDASGWMVYTARWALYLVGAASLIATGSAALVGWAHRARSGRDVPAPDPAADAALDYGRGATLLALLTLGAGRVVGAWWYWQAQGRLTGSDPREILIAVAWLVAAMSGLSWELAPRARRWAAGLPVLVGLPVLAGLVAVAGMLIVR